MTKVIENIIKAQINHERSVKVGYCGRAFMSGRAKSRVRLGPDMSHFAGLKTVLIIPEFQVYGKVYTYLLICFHKWADKRAVIWPYICLFPGNSTRSRWRNYYFPASNPRIVFNRINIFGYDRLTRLRSIVERPTLHDRYRLFPASNYNRYIYRQHSDIKTLWEYYYSQTLLYPFNFNQIHHNIYTAITTTLTFDGQPISFKSMPIDSVIVETFALYIYKFRPSHLRYSSISNILGWSYQCTD